MTDDTPMTTPPNVPVIGPLQERYRSILQAPIRVGLPEPNEEETGGPSDARDPDPAVDEEFVLVAEPGPPDESQSPVPPAGSDLDRLVQRLAASQANEELATTRRRAVDERLRFADLRIQMMERERDLLQQLADRPIHEASQARPEGRTGGPLKTSTPPPYSPRNNIGPSKWLFQMEMYFDYASISDGEKVWHAMIQLKDAAEAWWRSHILDTTDSQGLPTAERLTAWPDFSQRLKQVFTPVPEKKLARKKLYDLRQTGSVQMYTQAFRELTFILDNLAPEESMSLYERGLQPRILNEIYLKEPANVEEMILLAEKVDALRPGVGHAGPSRPAVHVPSRAAGGRFVRRAPARVNAVQAAGPPAMAPVAAVRPPPRRPAGPRSSTASQRSSSGQRPEPPAEGGTLFRL